MEGRTHKRKRPKFRVTKERGRWIIRRGSRSRAATEEERWLAEDARDAYACCVEIVEKWTDIQAQLDYANESRKYTVHVMRHFSALVARAKTLAMTIRRGNKHNWTHNHRDQANEAIDSLDRILPEAERVARITRENFGIQSDSVKSKGNNRAIQDI